MKFTAAAIAVASIGLGFASPFIAGLLEPVHDPSARQGFMYDWFYGIPAEVLAFAPVPGGSALFVAIGVFVIQSAALVGIVALVKWTFGSQPT